MIKLIRSYGKINLSLDITGVRSDGYHLISSVMAEIELCDNVKVETSYSDETQNKIILTSNLPYLPCTEKNTAYKAAKLFLEESGIKGITVKISIDKRLPVAGGLGGSSTNAAAVICALNEMTGCNFSADKLRDIAAKIGADVPFFIEGGIALAEGIGDKISKIDADIPGTVLIAKYGKGVKAQTIYKDFDKIGFEGEESTQSVLEAIKEKGDIGHAVGNMLTTVTSARQNNISAIIQLMKGSGAQGAEMSGSGSCVYGLYADIKSAEKGFAAVRRTYPEAEVFITRIKKR